MSVVIIVDFFGRELIAECLEINEDLACAIRENQDKTILMELAKKYGFQTMFEQVSAEK